MSVLPSLVRVLIACFCLIVMLVSGILSAYFFLCQAYSLLLALLLVFSLATSGLLASTSAEQRERAQASKHKLL